MVVLRILLYLLLGILALVGLLLSLCLKLDFQLNDASANALIVRVGLGPVVRTIVPAKKRKPVRLADFTYEKHQKRLKKDRIRARKKAERLEKRKRAHALMRQTGQTAKTEAAAEAAGEEVKSFTLESILDLLRFIFAEFPRFTSYLHTEVRMLDITVAGRDAADCAKKYGILAQLVSYLLELLNNGTAMKPLRPDAVAVRADFLAEKTVYRLDIRLRLRLFSLVRVALHTLVWMIQGKLKKK
ncbi:MAG: hypothetical protein ACI4V1_04270 [Eubacteriales bacterium]